MPNTYKQESMSAVPAEKSADTSKSAFEIMFEITQSLAPPRLSAGISIADDITDTPDVVLLAEGRKRASVIELPIKLIENFQDGLDNVLSELFKNKPYLIVKKTLHGKDISFAKASHDTPKIILEAQKLKEQLESIKQELYQVRAVMFSGSDVDDSASFDDQTPAAGSGFIPEIFESIARPFNQVSKGVFAGRFAWQAYRESIPLQKKIGELSKTIQALSSLTSKDKHLNKLKQLILEYSAPFKSTITFLSSQKDLVTTITNAEKMLLSTPSQVSHTEPEVSSSTDTFETKLKDLRLLYIKQFLSLNNTHLLIDYFEQAKAKQLELQQDLMAVTDANKKEQLNTLINTYVEAMHSQSLIYKAPESIMNAGGNLLATLNLNNDFFASYCLQLHEIYTDFVNTMPELLVEDNGFFSSLRTISSALKFPINRIAQLPHKEVHTQLAYLKAELEKSRKALSTSTILKKFDEDWLQFLSALDALTFQTGIAIGPFYPEHFTQERVVAIAKLQAEVAYPCRDLVKEKLTEDIMSLLRSKIEFLLPQKLDNIIQLERDLLPYIDTNSKLHEYIKEKIIFAYTNKNKPKGILANSLATLKSSLQSLVSLFASNNLADAKSNTESTAPSSSNEPTIDQVLALYLMQTPRELETIEHLKQFSVSEADAKIYLENALVEQDQAFIESQRKQVDAIYHSGRSLLQVTPLSDLCDLLAKEIHEVSAEKVEIYLDNDISAEMQVPKFKIFDSESAWIVRLKMAHNTLLELDYLIGRYKVGKIDWQYLLSSAWQMKHHLLAIAEEFTAICDSIMPWQVFGDSKDEHVSRVIDMSKDILTLFVPVDSTIPRSNDTPAENDALTLRHKRSQEQLQKDIDTIIVSLPNEIVNDAKNGLVVYTNMIKSLFVEIDNILSMEDKGSISKAGIALLNHENLGRLLDLVSKIDAIRSNSTINAVLDKYTTAIKSKIEAELVKIGQYEQANGLKIGYIASKATQQIPNLRPFFINSNGFLFDELNVFLVHYSNNLKAQEIADHLKQIGRTPNVNDLVTSRKTIDELSNNGIEVDDAKYTLGVLEERLTIPSSHQKVSPHQYLICEKQRTIATQQLRAGIFAIISDKMQAAQTALSNIEASLSNINDQMTAFQEKNSTDVDNYDRPTMVHYSTLNNERDIKIADKSAQEVTLSYYKKLLDIFNSDTPPTSINIAEIKADLNYQTQYIDEIKVIIKQLNNLKWNTYYYHHDCFKKHHEYFDSVMVEIKKIQANPSNPSNIQTAFARLNKLQVKLAAIPEMQHLYRAIQITCHQMRQHISKVIPDEVAKQQISAALNLEQLKLNSLSLERTPLHDKENVIREKLLIDVNQKYRHALPNSTEHACYQAAEEFLERWDINEEERGQRILIAMQYKENKSGKSVNKPNPQYINDLDDLNVFYKMTAPKGLCLHQSIFSEQNIATKIAVRNKFKSMVTEKSLKNQDLSELAKAIAIESKQIEKAMAKDRPLQDKINFLKEYFAKKNNTQTPKYYKILELITRLDKSDQATAVDELLSSVSQIETSEERMKAACKAFNDIAIEKQLPTLTPEQETYLIQKANASGGWFWRNNKQGKAELLIQALERGEHETIRLIASINTNNISRFFKRNTDGAKYFLTPEIKQQPAP